MTTGALERARTERRTPAATGLRTLLLATDLSESAEAATEQAIALAAAVHATLLVATVLDPSRAPRRERVDQLRGRAEAGLQAIVERARARGVRATFLVWEGEAAETIVSVAEAERVDLAVVGTHRFDGLRRFLLGSVSEYVIRHAPCPVLVVPPLA